MPERKPTRTADLDYFYGQSSELFSFYRIPKLLFQDSRFQPLSTDAKTLYGILLDRMSLSARNGWLDKAGRVFIIYTVQEVQDSLGCADKKATKLLRELEEYGLIERKRRGLGKPDLIYVKNFSSESSKTPYLNRDNDDSGTVQNALHSYDLLNQYAARSLAIVPENSRGYYWLIHSLKVQGMDELASNEYQLAKQHLTTEEYKELCTSLGDRCE